MKNAWNWGKKTSERKVQRKTNSALFWEVLHTGLDVRPLHKTSAQTPSLSSPRSMSTARMRSWYHVYIMELSCNNVILNLNIILVSYTIPNVWLERTGNILRTQKLGGHWCRVRLLCTASSRIDKEKCAFLRDPFFPMDPMEQHTAHTASDLSGWVETSSGTSPNSWWIDKGNPWLVMGLKVLLCPLRRRLWSCFKIFTDQRFKT